MPLRRNIRRFGPILLKNVGVSTHPNFFSAVGAIFRCGRWPHNPPQTQWSEF
jgi:hypothetical protein